MTNPEFHARCLRDELHRRHRRITELRNVLLCLLGRAKANGQTFEEFEKCCRLEPGQLAQVLYGDAVQVETKSNPMVF